MGGTAQDLRGESEAAKPETEPNHLILVRVRGQVKGRGRHLAVIPDLSVEPRLSKDKGKGQYPQDPGSTHLKGGEISLSRAFAGLYSVLLDQPVLTMKGDA